MTNAVQVRNVAKRFRVFANPMDRVLEYFDPFRREYGKDFWALEDVTFDVPAGRTIGILGRNGSGKSTLLQMVCGVLQPTRGEIDVDGRIAALLELGAGFCPDLTGRENAEFFCLQNGLTKAETAARLDEIGEFADVGEFFDRPMRTYSSGMFVRVAFAASIHVDPDILVVDEALSVGDARFQHKCFQRVQQLRDAGKTIIVVTHDLTAVVRHCDHAVLLERGRVVDSGEPREVVSVYHELLATGRSDRTLTQRSQPRQDEAPPPPPAKVATGTADVPFEGRTDAVARFAECPQYHSGELRFGDGRAEFVEFAVLADGEPLSSSVPCGATVEILARVYFHDAVEHAVFGFGFFTTDGVLVYGTNTAKSHELVDHVVPGESVVVRFRVTAPLQAGAYFLNLGCNQATPDGPVALDRRHSVLQVEFESAAEFDGLVDLASEFNTVRPQTGLARSA